MSTFSSVLRKPGQKITPRAAPRRNVQRQAQKAAAAANLNALTPESIIDGVEGQSTTLSKPSGAASTTEHESSETRLLTPPATAGDEASPPPEPSTQPVQIPSREHSLSVPPVIAENPASRAGSTRKAKDAANKAITPSIPLQASAAEERPTSPTAPKPRPSKRRKLAPQGAPSYLLSRSQDGPSSSPSTATATVTSTVTPVQRPPSSRRSTSRQSQASNSEIDQLLRRSRSGLESVGRLSRSIDPDTPRRLRSLSRQQSVAVPDVQDNDEDDQDFEPLNRMDALAATILDPSAPIPRGRKRDRRAQTPENPETYEINPDEVQMSQLTRDSGLGKRSEIGRRLDTEWAEIKARWDENAAENKRKAIEDRTTQKDRSRKAKSAIPNPEEGEPAQGIEMEIIDGQIVAASDAREQDFHAGLDVVPEEEAKLDEPIYRYVNSNRVGKKAGRIGGPQNRWNEEATDLFYKGLRMFGTDFEMIANMLFPGKTRKEIKDKFVREERSNHERIIENTRTREGVENLDELLKENEMGELKDPDDVMRELERDEERLRKQFEEKRAQESGGAVAVRVDGEDEAADTETVIPSIEVDGVEGVEGDVEDGEEEEEVTQLEGDEEPSLLEGVETTAPGSVRTMESARPLKPRKARQPRRTTRDTSKVKAGRKGKKPLEGVEERIGTIDDVER